ncbi:uncharacterized protein LOC142777194 isoform X2 [Rhipicephalus microplus]|uniref:uncharacterized protein LOC142777194 isoform X2 n=1 Tax=Rhipicephalus microplus TaxID=6941 RepID=UPI003F6D8518
MAVSRKYAVTLDFSHHKYADPCFPLRVRQLVARAVPDCARSATGYILEGHDWHSHAKQAPARTHNPSQRSSRTDTSWMAVLDSKEIEK